MSFNTRGNYAQQSFDQFEIELTGIWAEPQTVTLNVSNNGAERTIMFSSVNATENAASFISGQLPNSNLYPLIEFKSIIAIFDNTIVSTTPGVITISTDGSFIISPLGGLYSGTGSGGLPALSLTYFTSHP